VTAPSADVELLQTAASIDNAAVSAYNAALGLPAMATVAPYVRTFFLRTRDRHAQHAQAFNGAVTRLSGEPQTSADPKLARMVEDAKATLKFPFDVVQFVIKIETWASQTYQSAVVAVGDVAARKVAASILGVEAQHVAILTIMGELLQAAAPQLIAMPPEVGLFPGTAGSVGFPDSLQSTDRARPPDEGAVKRPRGTEVRGR
jgi:hypothetical protein